MDDRSGSYAGALEAGGKLALQAQGGALPDEISVNFRVRPVIVSDMTCK